MGRRYGAQRRDQSLLAWFQRLVRLQCPVHGDDLIDIGTNHLKRRVLVCKYSWHCFRINVDHKSWWIIPIHIEVTEGPAELRGKSLRSDAGLLELVALAAS
jgi:hypothetical protein